VPGRATGKVARPSANRGVVESRHRGDLPVEFERWTPCPAELVAYGTIERGRRGVCCGCAKPPRQPGIWGDVRVRL